MSLEITKSHDITKAHIKKLTLVQIVLKKYMRGYINKNKT